MMIPILKDYYAAGYLPDAKPDAIPPYLPNVNLAMRREMLAEIGGYDDDCLAGEDADLCVRAARAGWGQVFVPSACVYHEPRPTLLSLIRQWLWYVRGGSHFFFKMQEQRLEIYLDWRLTPKMHLYRKVVATRFFPFPAMLFISAFPLWHGAALLVVLVWAAGFQIPAALLVFVGLLLLGRSYLGSPLKKLSGKDLILYAAVGYVINWTCMLASLYTGFKKRRLFFYPGI
jgi:cellulose synthase/poly-beta-1,6-N-acetylglucosamine synthase-like glycosyltransferase